jgi:myosin heavy chain 6/7
MAEGDPPEEEILKYLAVPEAQRLKEQAATFDGKMVWVPKAGVEGYAGVSVISATDEDVVVKHADGVTEETVKKSVCEQMNPPKYEKCPDMANLTYLNEGSILYNLRARFMQALIYTYSGLFCIAINPFRRLPIYNDTCIKMFRGKRKVEMPPHVFAIVDNAYQNMLQEHDNQSMLITGESGAGKTENTKKVIMYIAKVAGDPVKKGDKAEAGKISGSLDEQIVEANPLMEAFGNAKTVRNNNSSRFGKFIRAHFSNTGKLAGADIESYLLEKNRVTFQLAAERNYHIFYQLLYATDDALLGELCLPTRVSADYAYLELGVPDVKGIDDHEEFGLTENSFVVLAFTPEERIQVYKISAGLLNISNIKMKNNRQEQAEIIDPAPGERFSHNFGLNVSDFHKSLVKPRVKVGTEFVNKAQSMAQVNFAISALSKSIFERMFLWQVMRINQALDTKVKRAYFIGVLDIAGFEIFDYNSFDQLCINITNEKLQQFFNHTMFVLEQEEYKKEGLKWDTMDFAMDLELTIQLVMNPGGVFPMLEEECMVPKGSDDSYLGKLHKAWAGKHQSYGKPPAKDKGKNGDFIIHHYAGSVGYHVNQWLDKNKDPINEDTAGLWSKAANGLVSHLFQEYNPDNKTKRKGSAFQTVSYKHREALKVLLDTLGATTPHFVRCIIPNEIKSGFELWGDLVLHQLRCNGVLEGIRICRKGFPSRMPFNDFKQRYCILAASAIPTGFVDGKVACEKLIGALQLDESEFRIGLTKVFFRSGIIGDLEDMRDERLAKILSQFQAYCKGNLQRVEYKKMRDRRVGLAVVQRNVRKHFGMKNWTWWKLYVQVLPMLTVAAAEADMKAQEEALKAAEEKAAADAAAAAAAAEELAKSMAEKENMMSELNNTSAALAQAEEMVMTLQTAKDGLQAELDAAQESLEEAERKAGQLGGDKKKQKAAIDDLTAKMAAATESIAKLETEKSSQAKQIEALNAEVASQGDAHGKLSKDKKAVEETLAATTESLQSAEDKGKKLAKEKQGVEETLGETKDALAKEKAAKEKLDKEKKKVEAALRDTEAKLADTTADLGIAKDTVVKRDKTIKEANENIEDLEKAIKGLQKKVADGLKRIEELEEEVEAEKKAKGKLDKEKAELASELEAAGGALSDAGDATSAQAAIVKKKDGDLAKLKAEMEASVAEGEAALSAQKSKLQAVIAEAQEETEDVKKALSKSQKDKAAAAAEAEDLGSQLEAAKKKGAASAKAASTAEAGLKAAKATIADLEAAVAEAASKPSGGVDPAAVAAATEELEHKLGVATKNAKNLAGQLEDANDAVAAESKAKSTANAKLKTALGDLEAANEALEEETAAKDAALAKLAAALKAVDAAKAAGGGGTVDQAAVDKVKKTLGGRIAEMEEALAAAEAKAANVEKAKGKMAAEVEDMLLDLDKAKAAAGALEKKQKKVDAVVADQKAKADAISAELDNSQRAERAATAEIVKLRAALEDASDAGDAAKKEVRALKASVAQLSDQVAEGGGASSADLAKLKARLDSEKEELTSQLEDAEAALEGEEAKAMKIQLELAAVRSAAERKLADKDNEIEALKKNHQRQTDALSGMVEEAGRGSGDVLKAKKALEGQVAELEHSLDAATRGSGDAAKTIKRLAAQVKDLSAALDEESRLKDEARDNGALAARKANDAAAAAEEIKLAYEQAERAKKLAQAEAADAIARAGEVSATLNHISAAKRKAEGDYHALQDEIDELENEKFAAQDRANKSAAELAKVVNELAAAQSATAAAEASRVNLANQISGLTARAEEAEGSQGKGLKAAIRKLEQRIIELESDLDTEARKAAEAVKVGRKAEKKVKELQLTTEDDAKAVAAANANGAKLSEKLNKMRLALDEAENNAASNASKYKKAIAELEDAEERCEAAEIALQKARQRARTASAAGTRSASRAPSAPRTPKSRTAGAGED